MRQSRAVALFVFAVALNISSADAIILYRTGDPTANTAAPDPSDVAGQGWNYEGVWGGFLGTPFAPHYFISAAHIGQAGGSTFTFQSVNYTIARGFYDPQSDFVIWKINETFPLFAPLYSGQDEVGQRTVAIGRGTQRGDAFFLNSAQFGWLWGPGDGVMRWGENVFSSIFPNGMNDDLLRAAFDQNGLPNECAFSSGDSGGATFLDDGGVCKLAGINYAVDGPYSESSDGSSDFLGALYDTRGLYEQAATGSPWTIVTGNSPVPVGFYDTRISTKLYWIANVIATPAVGFETPYVTFTYTQLITSPPIRYLVQQSIDLVNWGPATTIDEVVSTSGSTQVIKSKVDPGGATALFLRLQTANP